MGFSRQEHWSGLPFPSPKGTTERKKVKSLSCVQLFATSWTVAYQTPPSMEFSRQEYWSGLPFPSPANTIQFSTKDLSILRFLCWRWNLEPGPRGAQGMTRYLTVVLLPHLAPSCFSHVQLFSPVAFQAPLPMGFSRKEYWSQLPCPSPGDFPNLSQPNLLYSQRRDSPPTGFPTSESASQVPPFLQGQKYSLLHLSSWLCGHFSHRFICGVSLSMSLLEIIPGDPKLEDDHTLNGHGSGPHSDVSKGHTVPFVL